MNRLVLSLKALVMVLTLGTIHASFADEGNSHGGGGFQYPNSKALLKRVSQQLSDDIMQMDEQAFQNFPQGSRRNELAAIVRNVVSMPDVNTSRMNPDGEYEGLMFNYNTQSKLILALTPFFDAYKGLPIKEIERRKSRDHNFDDSNYQLTVADVRHRLLHELAHLLKIGVNENGSDDARGDEFAERLEKAMNDQFFVCESKDWYRPVGFPKDPPTYTTNGIWYGLVIHRKTGNVAEVDAVWSEDRKPYSSIVSVLNGARETMSNLVKNGYIDGFYAHPSPDGGIMKMPPSVYDVNDMQLKFASAPFQYQGDWSSNAYKISIDLTSGYGQFSIPTVDYSSVNRDVTYVDIPITCRAQSSVIRFDDLISK